MDFASGMARVSEVLHSRVTTSIALTVLYLWLSVIVAVLVTYKTAQRQSGVSLWRHLIPPGTLRNPSARADVLFWISLRVAFRFVSIPAIFSAAWAGSHLHDLIVRSLPIESHPVHTTPLLLCLFTLTMFLGYDVSYYWYHSLQHRIGWMWELHKVHHSAEVLVGVTKDRIHPFDTLMNHAWDALITCPIYAIWLFFILDPVEVTLLGINVYVLRGILMLDLIRHTHLKMSLGRLNGLIISPHYHQLHHSTNPKHYNKNFGLMLAVWDRMFGTFAVPEPGENFQFGLSDGEHHEYQSVLRLYCVPLIKIGALLFPTFKLRGTRNDLV